MTATADATALKLLTDEQMRQFVTYGCLVLQSTVPADVNAAIRDGLDAVTERKRLGNNNTLPMVPQLAQVFEDPVVAGAITSVAGPGATMHPHRAIHSTGPGSKDGGWHKDSYWGYSRKVRDHRPWWVMVMYYPQDTTEDMGPTAVLPGRFAHLTRKPEDDAGELKAVGNAGTFILIQYDIWHRATANVSDKHRYMCKFEFIRMEPPSAPTWDCQDRDWRELAPEQWPVYHHRGLWRNLWDWTAGNKTNHSPLPGDASKLGTWMDNLTSTDAATRATAADEIAMIGRPAAEAVSALIKLLSDEHEPAKMNAAYALAAIGEPAVAPLVDVLHSEDDITRRYAAYGLGAAGSVAADAVIEAAQHSDEKVRTEAMFALSEIGETDGRVAKALAKGAADEIDHVRLHAVDALGTLGINPHTSIAVDALESRLTDSDVEVRFNAVLGLARLSEAAAHTVPALRRCLRDENRYVQGYAVDALHRIGTAAALEALMPYLKASRWCPMTTNDSPFYP